MNSKEITQYMNYALRYFRVGETSRIEIKDDSERDDKPLKEIM